MSFWQSKNRGEMLVKSKQVEKIIYLGDLLIEKRSIGLGQYGLFLLGVENLNETDEKKLIEICKSENCLFVQIETINSFSVIPAKAGIYKNEEDNLIDPRVKHENDNDVIISLEGQHSSQFSVLSSFKSGYYKKFITPFTAIIDLSKTEEEILSEMKPKGRYNIRLSEKKGIVVKESEKIDENIKIFYNLLLQTTSRDGFAGNNSNYYKTFLETIEKSKLFIAYKDDYPIAAGIFVFYKEYSIYYYGASTNDEKYRNLMAPYLLQWTAIKNAKEIGSKYYDFLGVATPGDENSSLAGVTDFKLKFTKDVVNISDSYIWINNKFLYKVYKFLKFFRKHLF